MARQPRLVVPGYPHHLIQRGHNRGTVFTTDAERRRYLGELGEVAREHGVEIHAYVLMDNHVHLLATPSAEESLARLVQSLGRRYVAWFNHLHGRSGTLWEGRYRLGLVDTDAYLLVCQRYIELNPVRAGLVAEAGAYPWSSAAHHLGHRTDPLISDHPLFWQLGNTPFERQRAYGDWLAAGTPADEQQAIVSAVLKGQALAAPSRLPVLAAALKRPLAPRPRGRPRRSPALGSDKIHSDPIKNGASE